MHENIKLAYEMRLINPIQEKSSLALVPYTAEYQTAYKLIYNVCYREMREALRIKPYDFIQDDSFFENGMDSVFLLIKEQFSYMRTADLKSRTLLI